MSGKPTRRCGRSGPLGADRRLDADLFVLKRGVVVFRNFAPHAAGLPAYFTPPQHACFAILNSRCEENQKWDGVYQWIEVEDLPLPLSY